MSIYRAVSSCALAAVFSAALACGPVFSGDTRDSTAKAAYPMVVFVCKYGSSKSLWAAERFNKLAAQRGVPVRAIGRAANPGSFVHTEVSQTVAQQMALEGSNVADYKPQVLKPEEAAAAVRVVHISLQGEPDPNSSVVAAAAHVPEERWDDVPSMLKDPNGNVDLSGRQYNEARSKLLPHVDALFAEMAANKPGSVAAKRAE